ncbi:hypothetical protein [Deinococcus hopiensis]|uniref:Uncharacterized protein n=1 Tax=Deinococcus hopiensis KR-140 TaxID=695939 RepID=A0A1W1ULY1_9DEIO|nr:hypothetical protein [Deinococcus hopiensis]SMB82145.1 hypothetical protein SAMN00790413_04862 [Deinococcus hopiensis KR-140]
MQDLITTLWNAVRPATPESVVIVLFIIGVVIRTSVQGLRLGREHQQRHAELRALPDKLQGLSEIAVRRALGELRWNRVELTDAWDRASALRSLTSADPRAVTDSLSVIDEGRLYHLRQRPNQLMLLGLLGTVLGLSLTLGEFAPQLKTALSSLETGGTPQQLNAGLEGLLDRMKVAFVCTFWGVGASLLVARVLVAPAQLRRDRLQAELERLVAYDLIPRIWMQSAVLQEKMEQALSHNRQWMGEMQQLFTAQLEQFAHHTGRAMEGMQQAGQTLNTTALAASAAVQEAGAVLRSTTSTVDRSSDVLIQGVRSLETQLGRSISALEHNLQALQGQHSDFQTAQTHQLEAGAAQQDILQQALAQFTGTTIMLQERLDTTTQELRSGSQALAAQGDRLVEAQSAGLDELRGTLTALETDLRELGEGQLQKAVEQASQERAALRRLLDAHLQSAEQQRLEQQTAQQAVTGVFEGTLQTLVSDFDRRIETHLQTTERQVLQQQSVQQAAAAALEGTLQKLASDFDRLFTQQAITATGIEAELREVTRALTPLDELTQRLDPANLPQERWKAFEGALTDLATRWSGLQGQLDMRLTALTAALERERRLAGEQLSTQLAALHQTHLEQTTTMHGSLLTVTGALEQSLMASSERWAALNAEVKGQLIGTLQGQMNIAGQILQGQEAQQQETQRLIGEVAGTAQSIVREMQAVREQLVGTTTQLEAQAQATTGMVRSLPASLQTMATAQLNVSGGAFNGAVQLLSDSLTRLQEEAAAATRNNALRVTAAVEAMEQRSSAMIGSTVSELAEASKASSSAIVQATGQLNDTLQRFEQQTGETVAALHRVPAGLGDLADAQLRVGTGLLSDSTRELTSVLSGLQQQSAALTQAVETLQRTDGERSTSLRYELQGWSAFLDQAYRKLDGTVGRLDELLRAQPPFSAGTEALPDGAD